MVKDGQGRPDVLIPAQASGPSKPGPVGADGALSRPPLRSHAQTDPPSRRGGSPQDGSRPLREDGSVCTKTSGVPLPGTHLELGGRTGAPQARHLRGWRRFPQKPGWKWTAASPLVTTLNPLCPFPRHRMSRFPRQRLAMALASRPFGAFCTKSASHEQSPAEGVCLIGNV